MQTDPESIIWDVVIVGTGMGGATLGHALAKAGRRVLFVERGLDLQNSEQHGGFVEAVPGFRQLSADQQRQCLARGGRATAEFSSESTTFTPFIGAGTGGSSALYGMVLERLFPSDFTAEWPIRYDELASFYAAAERLYRVRGVADPLRPAIDGSALLPPPPMTPANQEIHATLERTGLHPYRLHTACEQLPGCRTCQGHLCHAACKNDAASICLSPAVNDHGASLLTECEALHLESGANQIRRLHCQWRDRRIALRAKLFVLAAGALLSPTLLVTALPGTRAGRNLMRHAIDLFVLTKAPSLPPNAFTKEIGCNDFYEGFGTLQSFGTAGPLAYLQNRPGFNIWRLLGPVAPLVWERFGRQPIFGAIMEDKPNVDNRIIANHLHYQLNSADQSRRRRFRRAVKRALAPFRPIRVSGTAELPALGHVCGTCRFGDDPGTSVLDRYNRAHGLENLYVVDASFFPSSGGVNPGLTIAANALRIAQHLISYA